MNWFAERLRSASAVVFDFYGTLVDDDVAFPAMWEDLARWGYRSSIALQAMFEPDGFDGCTTPSVHSTPNHDEWNRANLRRFVGLSGVPDDEIDTVLSRLEERQREYRAKAAPSACSITTRLRQQGLRIGLCSNWETPIEPFLHAAGLPAFDAISISSEVGVRKPHLHMFTDICAKLDVDPAATIFVGDNWSSDITGALRAGLTPVWIRGSKPSANLGHLVAEFTTLAELCVYVETIFQPGDTP